MLYQDIPFLICSKDDEISTQIANVLGRHENTVLAAPTLTAVNQFLNRIGYFTCQVFHYSSEGDQQLDVIITSTLKKRPFSANYLIAFSEVSESVYKQYIRAGITDILIFDEQHDDQTIRKNLLSTLNLKWRNFRYFERERNQMFHATVVTIFHEINQSLMVISNALDLFKIALKQNEPNIAKIEQAFHFIMKSTKKIQEILANLKQIEQPKLKDYTADVKMIDMEASVIRKKPD